MLPSTLNLRFRRVERAELRDRVWPGDSPALLCGRSARVSLHRRPGGDDLGGFVQGLQRQIEVPRNVVGRGRKVVRLEVGPGGVTRFDQDIEGKGLRENGSFRTRPGTYLGGS
jgi:hypothetical protein